MNIIDKKEYKNCIKNLRAKEKELIKRIENLEDVIDSAIEHLDASLVDQANRILNNEQNQR